MKVRDIAYSRSGDKGDISNVCVFVYDEKDWPLLERTLTVERVRERYKSVVFGSIDRYVFPRLHGLNFVMDEALGGGSAVSLRIDAHGKSMQSLILDIDLLPSGTDEEGGHDKN